MCTQSTEHGAFAQPYALHSPPNLLSQTLGQERRCWRNVADTVRLYPNWQVQTKGSRTRQYNISWTFVRRFSGCCRPTNTALHLHSCKLRLLMCQKAAIETNPVTPAEQKTGARTGCLTNLSLEMWRLLFCASGTSRTVHTSRVMLPSDTLRMRKLIWGFSLAKIGGTFRKCFYYYQHIVTIMYYIQAGKIKQGCW